MKKSWNEAQTHCREKYSDLATVYDMRDMKRIQNSTQHLTPAWIGLYSNPDNRTWHWSLPGVTYDEEEWLEPNDGSGLESLPRVMYDEEEWLELNDGGGLEKCVVIHNHKWLAYNCTRNATFICFDGENVLHNATLLITRGIKPVPFCSSCPQKQRNRTKGSIPLTKTEGGVMLRAIVDDITLTWPVVWIS